MKIKSTKSLGVQKVYSLEMAAPNHNYVLPNGLVSANSHSVAYAFVSYQTAFLKANYPAEFWAAQLSCEVDQMKINKMIIEAKSEGLSVLPVSVNTSSLGYEVIDIKSIRRSLGTLKAVGESAITELISHRPYNTVVDFVAKVSSRKINKKTLLTLIGAGAFDEFGITRKTLTKKILDCKEKMDKHVKKTVDAYIKSSGARKGCISKPEEQDLELLTTTSSNNADYQFFAEAATETLQRWTLAKPTVELEDYPSIEDAQKAELKIFMSEWEQQLSERLILNCWTYDFVETEEDKSEWELKELIAAEKAVYGTAVSAHLFDQFVDVEKMVMDRHPTNFYTFDTPMDKLSNGFDVVAMVEVTGMDRQFPYKKDPTKYVRLFLVEDRFGSGELTIFDKQYDDFIQDERGLAIRVWRPGNIIIVKAKVTDYGVRRSIVYEKCLKLVASDNKV